MQRLTRFAIAGFAALLLAVGPAAEGRVSSHLVKHTCNLKTLPLDANKRPVSITGTWSGNDGGTYWIRQIGTCVWWTGFSGSPDTTTMGKNFANVYFGSISTTSLRISGWWADVPRGSTTSNGTLRLGITVDSLGKARSLTRIGVTGGFGGTRWSRTS